MRILANGHGGTLPTSRLLPRCCQDSKRCQLSCRTTVRSKFKLSGPGWNRTNDQPIMSPERSRPIWFSDVDPNTKRQETRPTSPP